MFGWLVTLVGRRGSAWLEVGVQLGAWYGWKCPVGRSLKRCCGCVAGMTCSGLELWVAVLVDRVGSRACSTPTCEVAAVWFTDLKVGVVTRKRALGSRVVTPCLVQLKASF